MRKTSSVAVVVALVAAALGVSSPTAAAVNGRIAFVSGRAGGLPEIWTADSTGAGARNETRAPDAVDVDPAWRPDGTRIAFARQGKSDEVFELWTMNADGSSKARLIGTAGGVSDREPAWSTTGRIAFTRMSRAAGSSHIWSVDDTGLRTRQLTETPAPSWDSSPDWSPDGTRIAFTSNRGGTPQIWVMDAEGFTESQVTTDPGCWAANPSWNPLAADDRIVFERFCPGSPTGWDLAIVDPDVSVAPIAVTATADHDQQPAWSPDGERVVFTRYPASGGDKDLVTVAADGTGQLGVAGSPQADMTADWGTAPVLPREASSARTATPTDGLRAGASPETVAARDTAAPKRKGDRRKKRKKKRRRKIKVAPGVRYERTRKAKSDVYVLRVKPEAAATLDVALSNDRLSGHERTTRMSKRHGAIAAINGDFGMPTGRPAHTFAEDGDLKQLSYAAAWNFAMSRDEQRTFFARPFETVTSSENDTWRIDRWNFGTPAANDIAVVTPAAGDVVRPPSNACSARVVPAAGPRFAPGRAGVETTFRVEAVACAAAPMPLGGGIVLAAQPGSEGSVVLNSLSVGETMQVTWSLGWEGVTETVGGIPLLVDDGRIVADRCSASLCARHPRTAIGVTSTGRILMVVVDGRRKGSKGVTLVKLAKVMRDLGAVDALNLDGGGSSTMVVRGKVMNVPSDGRERKVSSAILVLPGADLGEAVGPSAARPLAAAPETPGAGERATSDPASTGGLLEAMVEGTFGAPTELSPRLRRALRDFRASS